MLPPELFEISSLVLLISFVVILQCIDTELSIGIGILSLYVSSALLSDCVSISCTVYRLHLAFHNICGVDSFSAISFSYGVLRNWFFSNIQSD